MLNFLNKILFPKKCVLCGYPNSNICHKCAKLLQPTDFSTCIYCENLCVNGYTHRYCLNFVACNQFIILYDFTSKLSKLILKAKANQFSYTLVNNLIKPNLLKDYETTLKLVDYAIPIPISTSKGRFENHSFYIAKCIKAKCKLKYKIISNISVKKHLKQKELNRTERFLNAKKYSFKINVRPNQLENKNILVVDDISTTGATLFAMIETLNNFKPKEINCLVLAKKSRFKV